MKAYVILLLILVLSIIVISGCHPAPVSEIKKPIIHIRSGSEFPPELAGTWAIKTKRWYFTIEEDGTISKIVRSLIKGSVVFQENDFFEIMEEKNNFSARFFWGPCIANYDPQTRTLEITLVMEHFIISSDAFETVEGSMRDTLVGVISEDYKTWDANLLSEGTADKLVSDTLSPKKLFFAKVSSGFDNAKNK